MKAQGVSPVVNEVGNLLSAEETSVFHVGDEPFKTVAIWRVMSAQTEKALGEMWEEAKRGRK